MAGNTARPHAIMIPYPYQGHINPFVSLAVKLASHGFTITFVNTESVHRRISRAQTGNDDRAADIFSAARGAGLDIRYATVSDGFPLGFDRSVNHDQFVEGLIHVFSAHVDELVGDLAGSDPPVTCLIADTFYVWASEVARRHNLVCVSFWTEPALVLSLYYHLDLLRKNGHFGSEDRRRDAIDYIPGVGAMKPTDLMSYLQADDIHTVVHRVIYRAFEDVKKADVIICNTVQELEFNTLSALNIKQPTYAIGPIVSGFTNRTVATSLWSESDCTPWLNTKPKGSVLYVSFGSHAHTTSKQDIWEIAQGLLLSGVSFVWVIRPDIVNSDEGNFLPDGFESSMKGRGMIVQWCSQIKVISHPSIGGFLSHCGWNSVLESIWCRVPLICFPLFTDQFTNRKLVVNDWKIGINLCDRASMTREEVVEKIRYLMSGRSSEELEKMAMKKPHAIMVSFHLQGHVIPFVNLAIKLASKGFSITFAHLEAIHHQICGAQSDGAGETDIFAGARSSGLDIRYTTFSDGFPLDLDRAFDLDYLKFVLGGFVDCVDELVGGILQSDSPDPAYNYFLISDTFSIWSEKIAEKYSLVNVSFWTEAALVFSLYYHLELLRENGHVPVNGRREIVEYLPGIDSISTKDFLSYYHDTEFQPLHELIYDSFRAVRNADFILCNTVQEVEAEVISALQQKQPFYSVGQLSPADFSGSSVAKSLLPEMATDSWLNSRPAGSVLYVSFGSLATTDRNVIAEIAGGLLMTEVNFVWVVRPGMVDSGNGGVLPEGFEDRTRNRGLVVPWCSQTSVLSNPAIGGFLTHCGWNSILESICFGVPMICYPFFADQITNRKLVVDDWKVGINLCEDGESINKEEVAEKIEVLMSSVEMRERVQKMKGTFQSAISVGGSSEKNFDRFIDDVSLEISK